MPALKLQLPTIQNWSCQSCGACCRQHLITITDEERARIESQNWTPADGIPASRPLFVWQMGPPWRKKYRLGHQADGACIFLDERNLCRIHAKFGEAAKPLACRVYPYAFHPAGSKVAVSLRFSCPSVVANAGTPVTDQTKPIQEIADLIVPERIGEIAPPDVNAREKVDWPDFLRFVDAVDRTLANREVPISTKIRRALFWVGLVDQAKFDAVKGARLGELLGLLRDAAEAETPLDPFQVEPPTRTGKTQFRMLVAQYARKDTLVSRESGLAGRWRLFRAAMKFACGKGNVPPLQDSFREVPFAALEEPFGPLTPEMEEILTRYFRVKVQGLHFCGRGYYRIPFVEGFYSLALVLPSVLWLARWLAVGEGRKALIKEDLVRAIASADHYHAFSPAFGTGTFRRRVRILNQLGDITRLAAWYCR